MIPYLPVPNASLCQIPASNHSHLHSFLFHTLFNSRSLLLFSRSLDSLLLVDPSTLPVISMDSHGVFVRGSGEDWYGRGGWDIPFAHGNTPAISDLQVFLERGNRAMEGFLGLITENSSAGEEMRMILFCGFLVCLALWGFLASTRGHDTNIGSIHVLYV